MQKECGELARYLYWRGAEGMSVDRGAVADFAEMVYIRLGIDCGSVYAEELRWKLRDYAVEAFEAF
jgi:hypothetical protein